MSWWNIIKGADNHLKVIENLFTNNPDKAIGYIPVDWGVGKENEIQTLASKLGLQYKLFPSEKPMLNEQWHSYANGGHFMWDENKVNAILDETEFKSADELVAFIANNSYRSKPYRRVIDKIFGTPKVTLMTDKKEKRMKGLQRGFE